jgi:hypothetical protein
LWLVADGHSGPTRVPRGCTAYSTRLAISNSSSLRLRGRRLGYSCQSSSTTIRRILCHQDRASDASCPHVDGNPKLSLRSPPATRSIGSNSNTTPPPFVLPPEASPAAYGLRRSSLPVHHRRLTGRDIPMCYLSSPFYHQITPLTLLLSPLANR